MQMGYLVMGKNNYAELFSYILSDQLRHARFLNTLSLMELCGAKKLTRLLAHKSDIFLLEHIAEEYRHAYYLRKLSNKVVGHDLDFSPLNLLHPIAAKRYINHLDIKACILIKNKHPDKQYPIHQAAFLLCTHAIENRALTFYQSYQNYLDAVGLSINVKSIISEEEKHLEEINKYLEKDTLLSSLSDEVIAIENKLFDAWVNGLYRPHD